MPELAASYVDSSYCVMDAIFFGEIRVIIFGKINTLNKIYIIGHYLDYICIIEARNNF